MSVVAAGATPRVVANATADMGRVRAALAGITATPATADMGEALALASALAARAGDAQVLVATDAAFDAAERTSTSRRPSPSSRWAASGRTRRSSPSPCAARRPR